MPPPPAKRLKLIPKEPDTPPLSKVEAKAVPPKVNCASDSIDGKKIGIAMFVNIQRMLNFELCNGGTDLCMYVCWCVNKQVL